LSACWISASPLARISTDCEARMLAIAPDKFAAPHDEAAAHHRGDGPAGNCHVLVRPSRLRIEQATRHPDAQY
jgi:hypothetical protein